MLIVGQVSPWGVVLDFDCLRMLEKESMSFPLVSVTVPAFNCRKFIAETLESLLAQSYPNLEVIVVDDGSTDDTAGALRPYMDRIVYHRQHNAGLGAARNTGMRLSRGEYIAWCDADDLSDRDRLLTQAAYLAHNPAAVAVGSDFSALDVDGSVFDPAYAKSYYAELNLRGLDGMFENAEVFDGRTVGWLPQPLVPSRCVHWGNVWHRLLVGNFMHPPTMMIRSSVREQVGWLREDVRGSEDWEYITRIARQGAMAFIDAALLKYRCHPGQMSSANTPADIRTRLQVLQSHLRLGEHASPELHDELQAKLARSHAAASYLLAEQHKREALGHLAAAVSMDVRHSRPLFHLARIVVPGVVLRLARAVRATGRTSHP